MLRSVDEAVCEGSAADSAVFSLHGPIVSVSLFGSVRIDSGIKMERSL